MNAYITSIGEKTTDVCVDQIGRFGFTPYLYDGIEPWRYKYWRFIMTAKAPCIRLDADVVPNAAIASLATMEVPAGMLGIQAKTYCLYANGLVDSVILYTREALDIIGRNSDKISPDRPEASAWRLPETKDRLFTIPLVVGLHGFFQDDAHFNRAMKHKTERKQLDRYDFDLAKKLLSL